MRNLKISSEILAKLAAKHDVSKSEVEQCFSNRGGRLLEDRRAKHKSNPPTLWFIAPTNKGRMLKIVYIQDGISITLRSAFPPNAQETDIYIRHGSR